MAARFGWRLSVSVWAIFVVLAVVAWVLLGSRGRRSTVGPAATIATVPGHLWRRPAVWALVVTFSVAATLAYVSFTWLPLLRSSGLSASTAGALLALCAGIGLPLSLAIPWLSTHRRISLVLSVLAAVAGGALVGLLIAPRAVPRCGCPCWRRPGCSFRCR